MTPFSRRRFLGMTLTAPLLPGLGLRTVEAAQPTRDGRVLIVVRLLGGNDGLNAVVPVRNDLYYRMRPTIAIPRAATLPLPGIDAGLHPSLAKFHSLIEEGLAGVVLGVGYPGASRSHVRSTEIWETGSVDPEAPAHGWLGRHLDSRATAGPVSAIQFGDVLARSLAAGSDVARLIGHPRALLELDAERLDAAGRHMAQDARFAPVERANRALLDSARQVQRASRGRGSSHPYPATAFGEALRWTGNMIETECPTRVFYLQAGAFADGSVSFDTHIDQLAAHELLYAELAQGISALMNHLRKTGDASRVTLITFSDFGRQLAENRTRGTEHGEASVLFFAGGNVNAGVLGRMPDLAELSGGGLRYNVDFRAIYSDLLENWLGGDATRLHADGIGALHLVRGA